MYIDEGNFVSEKVYFELLPNVLTDRGKLIVMSSHKTTTNNDLECVDLDSVRDQSVLLNSVSYVCVSHLNQLLSNKQVSISCCNCFQMLKPNHITIPTEYRTFIDLFSTLNGGNTGGDTLNKEGAMLAEIGVDIRKRLNCANASQHVITISNTSTFNLAQPKALNIFHNKKINITDRFMKNKDPDLYLDKNIMIYIDPAMHQLHHSYNAHTYMAIVRKRSTGCIQLYIILAVEEFSSTDLDKSPFQLFEQANAEVLIGTIKDITELYEGYFEHFIVAVERNSLGVEYVTRQVSHLRNKMNIKPSIMFVCQLVEARPIVLGPKRQKIDHCGTVTTTQQKDNLVLGYWLTDKVVNCKLFYNEAFNSHKVKCADLIFSRYTKGKPLVTTIMNQIKNMNLKCTKFNNGKYNIKVTGKGKGTQDDIAISVIQCVILFNKYIQNDLRYYIVPTTVQTDQPINTEGNIETQTTNFSFV